MKKAKIILTAIAVFAIAGGAIAFKAKRTDLRVMIYFSTKLTQRIIGGFTYTTTVNSCVVDPSAFIGPVGDATNTFYNSFITITGFSAGNPRTWQELVCTTGDVLTTLIAE